MRFPFLFVLLLTTALLYAQSDSDKTFTRSPVFLQVGVGTLPTTDLFCTEFSAAVGYQAGQYFGIGLEYRTTGSASVSISRSARVLGVHLRRQSPGGWMLNVGGGAVLDAGESDDGYFQYEYHSGGTYLAADVCYQLRWGLTVGVYVTAVWGQTFDDFEFNIDTNEYEPLSTRHEDQFAGLGVKIGYAFPFRSRR
ncbi:MAG: hypothetical protein AAF597_00685 [Bacteroidota bacterium]